MDLDVAMRALAASQHGLVSRPQARVMGATRQHLRRRVASGDWAEVSTKVLRLVGSVRTFRQRCMAAALDAGPRAYVSHEAAAALWELPGFTRGQLSVVRAKGRSSRPTHLARLHQSCSLPPAHLTVVHGIPVTTVARTVFNLAGVLHPGRTERALDNALARRLTDLAALHAVVDDLAEHGRAGSAVMRRLLTERSDGYRAPESGLEASFEAILEAAGAAVPARQVDVGGERWLGRADYLDGNRVIEVDSDLHHTSASDRRADARRDEAMRAAGFEVIRIREHQLRHRPEEVVAAVR